MIESRKLNIIYNKSGGCGGMTTRLTLPKTWVDRLGITPDSKAVIVSFDGSAITIKRDS